MSDLFNTDEVLNFDEQVEFNLEDPDADYWFQRELDQDNFYYYWQKYHTETVEQSEPEEPDNILPSFTDFE